MDTMQQQQQQQQQSWGQEVSLGLEEDDFDLSNMFTVDAVDDLDSTPAINFFEFDAAYNAHEVQQLQQHSKYQQQQQQQRHLEEDDSDASIWLSDGDDHFLSNDSVPTAPSTPTSTADAQEFFKAGGDMKKSLASQGPAISNAATVDQFALGPDQQHPGHQAHTCSTAGAHTTAYAQHLETTKDGRKRKNPKPYGKVLSTIKSNRAKQAEVVECAAIPKKEHRVKGVVYVINGDAKRWDGRQWRRLCIVHDCHSAARGSGDLCIAHSKGELKKVVIDNEVVEVVALGEEAAAQATAIAPVPSVIAAMRSAQPVQNKKRKATYMASSDVAAAGNPPRSKMMRTGAASRTHSLRYDPSYTSATPHTYQCVL